MYFLDGYISDEEEEDVIFLPYQWIGKVETRKVQVDGGYIEVVDAAVAKDARKAVAKDAARKAARKAAMKKRIG